MEINVLFNIGVKNVALAFWILVQASAFCDLPLYLRGDQSVSLVPRETGDRALRQSFEECARGRPLHGLTVIHDMLMCPAHKSWLEERKHQVVCSSIEHNKVADRSLCHNSTSCPLANSITILQVLTLMDLGQAPTKTFRAKWRPLKWQH